MDDSAIICDEVIDPDADAEAKSNDEAKSNNESIFMERKQPLKHKISIFCLHFY